MAKAQGVSPATVQRVWDAHNIKPWRVDTFKLSDDKRFLEELTDVVGLYLNPPEKAIVLRMDEQSQVQALDRTQPSLPVRPGRAANVNAWLAKHPRCHLHFTPTSSSWLNLIERWFRGLTPSALRRGVLHSVPELIAAIENYLAAHNQDPRPFVWAAETEAIWKRPIAHTPIGGMSVNRSLCEAFRSGRPRPAITRTG